MKRLILAVSLLLLISHFTMAHAQTSGRLAEGTLLRMATSRKITWQTLELSYSCRLKTAEKTVKRPLLYLIVLTQDADGNQLLSRYYTIGGSDKVRQADPPYERWSAYDATGFTMAELKAFHEQGWPAKVLSWGETEETDANELRTLSRKRLKVATVDKGVELLAWRLELWHDGSMLDLRSKPVKAVLLRKQIPLNWHMAHKGPFVPPSEAEPEKPQPPTEPEPEEESPDQEEEE